MTPRQIRFQRAAVAFMPGLWSFAYPVHDRPFRPLRLVALRLWIVLFRFHMQRREAREY